MRNRPLFTATVRYDRMADNGVVAEVTEQYLVEAYSYTEAETTATAVVREMTARKGRMQLTNLAKMRVAEVMVDRDGGDDLFWSARFSITTINDKGVEKEAVLQAIVGGGDFDTAYRRFLEGMRPSVSDWRLVSLKKLPAQGYLIRDDAPGAHGDGTGS